MSENNKHGLSYRDAGVDIDAGDALVERIKPIAARTQRPESLGSLGGFGALFAVPCGYREPVLVSGTDGVGTKVLLAAQWDDHTGIGQDLVAMCVNDILALGAEPLFFLDYYACGQLHVERAAAVIEGIGRGCELAGCALVGGESAEMPGVYAGEDYDLAGFCVGVAERDGLIDGSRIRAGHRLIGLPSSGPHSNGYSLIRRIVERAGAAPDTGINGVALREALLAPTRIYVRDVLAVLQSHRIDGMAHITGGGLPGNIARILPGGLGARIDTASWSRATIFNWLQEQGNVDEAEMLRTFNCGIGFVLVADEETATRCLQHLDGRALDIGRVVEVDAGDAAVQFGDQA